MDNLDVNTEKRILDSARNIFHKKGLAGARMKEIANEAGINQAMLHYYYRSKEKLFDAVFREAFMRVIPEIKQILSKDLPLFEKIKFFTDSYISILLDNLYLPTFIINEIHQNPEKMKTLFIEYQIAPPNEFLEQIFKAIEEKQIKPIDPKHLVLNIISMCIFPVAARPIIESVFNMTQEEYFEFLKQRKKEVSEFVINAIKIKQT